MYALQMLHVLLRQSTLVLELSQQSQLKYRMFGWDKCFFVKQQNVKIELTARELLRPDMVMGQRKDSTCGIIVLFLILKLVAFVLPISCNKRENGWCMHTIQDA